MTEAAMIAQKRRTEVMEQGRIATHESTAPSLPLLRFSFL